MTGILAGGLVFVVVAAIAAVVIARSRVRHAVQEAERAAIMKNDFVSMVSHELRTPLTSIAGFASLLAESWNELPPEEVDEFLRIIRAQSGHLEELVEDVLVIPRLDAGRLRLDLEVFDFSTLAHEISELIFPPTSGRDVRVSIPGGVMVHADRRRVAQVLRNLLDNARKYGGDQILVDGANVGEHYLVVVSDNGPGVAESEREIIFRHFEQVSKGDARVNEGIGLGLPIARKLARAMGGDVWHETRFPTGSRFCFTLRIVPPEEGNLMEGDPARMERAVERRTRIDSP